MARLASLYSVVVIRSCAPPAARSRTLRNGADPSQPFAGALAFRARGAVHTKEAVLKSMVPSSVPAMRPSSVRMKTWPV